MPESAAACTGDDSCKVPDHWPDPASSGPHREPATAAKPSYCPWCGARVAEWGHDDNCPRPTDEPDVVRLVDGHGGAAMSAGRALRRLRAIGDALDHRDKAAEQAAYVAFDRAFPGLSKPVAVKPNLRRKGWRHGR